MTVERLPEESDIAYFTRTDIMPKLRPQPGIAFDPQYAIDTAAAPHPNQLRFGWVGPFPSRPCDNCGNSDFQAGDWSMGYRCTACQSTFGTPEEWKY